MKEKILIAFVFILTVLSGVACFFTMYYLTPRISIEAKALGIICSAKMEDFYRSEITMSDKIKPNINQSVNKESSKIKGKIFKGIDIQNYDDYIEGTTYKVRAIAKKNKLKILKEMDEQDLRSLEFYGYINTEPTPTLILRSTGVYDDSYHYTKIKVNTKTKKVVSVSYPEPEVFYTKDSIVNTGNIEDPGGNITYFVKIDNLSDYSNAIKKDKAKLFKKYIFNKANEYKDYHFILYEKNVLRLEATKLSNNKRVILKFRYNKDMYYLGDDKYKTSYSFSYDGEEKERKK